MESSTPGGATSSNSMLHTAPSSGEDGLKKSGSDDGKLTVIPSARKAEIGDSTIMPPPAVPREGDSIEMSPLKPGSGKRGDDGAESSDEPGSGSKRKRGSGRRGEEMEERAKLQGALGFERIRWGLMLKQYVTVKSYNIYVHENGGRFFQNWCNCLIYSQGIGFVIDQDVFVFCRYSGFVSWRVRYGNWRTL